jgi:hypothetical protein
VTVKTNAELWAMVVGMAWANEDWKAAWREVRKEGGRDLVKTEEDFQAIYGRFKAQHLFAAQWVLNAKRLEFQASLSDAVWELDPATDEETDTFVTNLKEFQEGSFTALLACLNTIRVKRPTLANDLEATARQLHPHAFKATDARQPSAQLEFSLQPVTEQPEHVPELPSEVQL